MKETKLRAEDFEILNQSLDVIWRYFINFWIILKTNVPNLSDAIKKESNEREEVDRDIMKKTAEEMFRLNENIQIEKKNREESEIAIYDMLKDVVNRVKNEIDTEKKTRWIYVFFVYLFDFSFYREATEENLLSLLEDTCNKLNSASHL